MSIINDQNRLARDKAESWFKFEKVGDSCEGIIEDMFETEANAGMPAQRVFTVKTEKGTYLNIPLKKTRYVTDRTDDLEVGDGIGAKFEKEIPPKQKGFSAAKSIALFIQKKEGPRTGENAGKLSPEKSEADKQFDAMGEDENDDTPEGKPF